MKQKKQKKQKFVVEVVWSPPAREDSTLRTKASVRAAFLEVLLSRTYFDNEKHIRVRKVDLD